MTAPTPSPPSLLATAASAVIDGWSAAGWAVLDPWEGALAARALPPPTFFALARPSTVRWVSRQVVRQPSEARYGKSPVRQIRSTQVRVLSRPAPVDLFERFLESLRRPELGLADRELRLRPVEWRVRDLGVSGYGWMALLDGLLVARWIELETVGGVAVDPPAVELTYGVERLALIASTERSLRRLQAAHCPEAARQRSREEEDLSRHLLEVVGETELIRGLERELAAAERALDHHLPLPAYEAILRAIQCAEVLRARGAARTLREARGGRRLTELAGRCRALIASPEPAAEVGEAIEGDQGDHSEGDHDAGDRDGDERDGGDG